MLMYSANIYFWRRSKINYAFIFGFKQGTELSYREVLLLSSVLAVLTWAAVLTNLDMEMDIRTKSFSAFTELVPLALLVVLIIITFCPFNIIYKSSRFFFIHCMFRCICAPLYKVTLVDNIFTDQLTSQCLRRFVLEERNAMHGFNGLKYMSTIFSIATRTGNQLTHNRGVPWRILAAASSGVATIMNTYWDIVIDWGLLQRHSRNPWLRHKLSVSNKIVYFVAMVLNVLLRLAWMQSGLGVTQAPFLHRKA